jgi:hypothetical protein
MVRNADLFRRRLTANTVNKKVQLNGHMKTRMVAASPNSDVVSNLRKQENAAPFSNVITVTRNTCAFLTATRTIQTGGQSGYKGSARNVLNVTAATAQGDYQNAITEQAYDTVRQNSEESNRSPIKSYSAGSTLNARSGSSVADSRCESRYKTALPDFSSTHAGRGNPVCSGQMHPSRFDRGRARQLTPHDTLEASRAFSVMRKSFFLDYLRGTLYGGDEQEIGTAADIFEGDAWQRALEETSREALGTPVLLTDRMSDRTLAGYVTTSNPTIPRAILINTRFKVDPEVLAHALAEEVVHAQQDIDGVDFVGQKAAYAYADRPYEQDAKARATRIVGYEPENYADYKRREVPGGMLFDGLSNMAERESRKTASSITRSLTSTWLTRQRLAPSAMPLRRALRRADQ